LVPLRFFAEELGFSVSWSERTSNVVIRGDGREISIIIGANEAIVDGVIVELDAPAVLRAGRTMVPVRFVSESFGYNVTWTSGVESVVLMRR
jgi:N-acetylmuramoyl-L-alanine amidase